MMKGALGLFCGGLVISLATASASAVTNPSFETGNFSGYSTVGNTGVQTAFGALAPTDGSFHALMTTNKSATGGNPAAPKASLESFVGANFANGFDGSAIKTTFTVSETSSVSFDFSLGALGTTGGNDIAFAVLNDQVFVLADRASSSFTVSANGYNLTDYQTFAALPTVDAGTHTLVIGVVNIGTGTGRSALFIDNLLVAAAGAASVGGSVATPEPMTAGLILLGLGATTWATRRRRNAAE